jgi:hypothetical protein
MKPHWPTVLGAALVAYVGAKVLHEGVGHGLSCLAVGGDWVGVSSSWSMCEGVEGWPRRVVKASGTIANLVAGGAALAMVRGERWYGAWIFAAVNLLMGAGYVMVDPIGGFGDWTAFLEGLPGGLRWVLVAVGVAMYFAAIRVLLRAAHPFVGNEPARLRPLTLVPWLVVGGAAMTGAAMLNQLGPKYGLTSALATVGGTSALAWMSELLDKLSPGEGRWPGADRGWLVAGAVALLALPVLGYGLTW